MSSSTRRASAATRTHRPAVDLNRVGAAGAALVDGDVGGAHDAGRVLERDVEFVGHHLAERRAGSLSAVGLADEEVAVLS
jgi:hypothetical protein